MQEYYLLYNEKSTTTYDHFRNFKRKNWSRGIGYKIHILDLKVEFKHKKMMEIWIG